MIKSVLTDVPHFEVRVFRKRGKLEIVEVLEWGQMKGGEQNGNALTGRAKEAFINELLFIKDRESNIRDERMQPRTLTPSPPRPHNPWSVIDPMDGSRSFLFNEATNDRMNLTIRNAKKVLAEVGMVLIHNDGEYRVNFKGGKEATASYTNDLSDAVETGFAMVKR